MDWLSVLKDLLIPISGILVAWLGWLEMRFKNMMSEVDRKIRDTNKINEIVQKDLKEDIARLEQKIDMLIQLQIIGNKHDKAA